MDADPSVKSYLDIVERAFSNRGRIVASVFLNMELYMVAIGLMIAESDNLHKHFPAFAIDGVGALVISGRKTLI